MSSGREVVACGEGALRTTRSTFGLEGWGDVCPSLHGMKSYPARLHHRVPGWVKTGARFHIRIRTLFPPDVVLAEPKKAGALLAAAKAYHDSGHWWCDLCLLMPNHLHALLAFPADVTMSTVVRNWKRGTARIHGIKWQDNYFDHRIRNEKEADEAWWYIRRNPVVKGLCRSEDDWPWWWSPGLEAG